MREIQTTNFQVGIQQRVKNCGFLDWSMGDYHVMRNYHVIGDYQVMGDYHVNFEWGKKIFAKPSISLFITKMKKSRLNKYKSYFLFSSYFVLRHIEYFGAFG
uniref:Uncharacterized protein n=1 Tax=Cacopsylla melanoneura TaxID=428564 RepID=A0A8D8TYL5_9HEMI